MAAFVAMSGCRTGTATTTAAATTSAAVSSTATTTGVATTGTPGTASASVKGSYPWQPTSAERLDQRFAAPDGFTRVAVEEGSFGSFLRTLPLLPDGAQVVSYRGDPLYQNGHHASIAAVADLDVGTRDLQHCADVIIRLNAEWHYGRGERDIGYKSVSGARLSYKQYLAGERAVVEAGKFTLRPAARPKMDDHAAFRAWLDDVFAWAGTASLERDAEKVAIGDLRPGDFFVMSGRPFGHAVLVLDVAKDDRGRVAMLLGQSYMPAQSFHVLRRSESSAWFVLEPGAQLVDTPFWQPFPIGALRRLP